MKVRLRGTEYVGNGTGLGWGGVYILKDLQLPEEETEKLSQSSVMRGLGYIASGQF